METMINVTPKAVEKIRETLARHHATGGLRLGVAGGGCSGLTYKFKLEAEPRSTDQVFEFDGVNVVWQHRTWGHTPDPKYPWGATFYGDKGTLKASVMSYDFTPHGDGQPIHRDVTYEFEKYPEDRTEKDLKSLQIVKKMAEEKQKEELWNLVNQALEIADGARAGAETGLTRFKATGSRKTKG